MKMTKETISQPVFFSEWKRVLLAGDGNLNYSPLSLYYALALAGCGAENETAAQIADCLGIQEQSQLAEQCRKLYQWIAYYGQRQKMRYEEYGGKYGWERTKPRIK